MKNKKLMQKTKFNYKTSLNNSMLVSKYENLDKQSGFFGGRRVEAYST